MMPGQQLAERMDQLSKDADVYLTRPRSLKRTFPGRILTYIFLHRVLVALLCMHVLCARK